MNSRPHPRSHNQAYAVGPRSQAEFARAQAITPGGSMRIAPYFPPQPPYAASGSGCWVTDIDGRRLFDCANNFFSLIHGHAFPPVIAALHEVLDRGTAFGLPTALETELAETVRRRAPRLEQIRFCNSGTEAVLFAIKAARALTGRPAIAKFEGAYHGAYDHAEISLDPHPQNWGEERPASVPYARGTPAAVATDTIVLPFNDPAAVRRLLEDNGSRLAGVLFDPLAARVGMVPASPELCEVLQDACRRLGILLIADEVIAFRLDHRGAHTVFGLEPDLVALGKIIGGGLPVGAVAGPAGSMAIFDHTKGKPAVAHGGTFSANPLTMTAGLASLAAYDEAAVQRLNRLGAELRESGAAGLAGQKLPAQITGFGSLFRIHLTRAPISDYRSSYASPVQRTALAAVHRGLLERGILIAPTGAGALSTPMGEGDIHDLSAAIVDSVADIHSNQPWA